MSEYYVLIFFIIPTIELFVNKFIRSRIVVLVSYFAFITTVATLIIICNLYALKSEFVNVKILSVLLCVLLGIFLYVIDLVIKNIVLNDVLILDFTYYFSFNRETSFKILLSVLIAFEEELIFRFPLCLFERISFFLLFAGTLSFGLAHIFFSKYDVASKMIIGILLGIISIVSHNVFHAIIIHAVYNLIVGICGGINLKNII